MELVDSVEQSDYTGMYSSTRKTKKRGSRACEGEGGPRHKPLRGARFKAMVCPVSRVNSLRGSLSYLGLREPVVLVGLQTPGYAWCDLGDAESSKCPTEPYFSGTDTPTRQRWGGGGVL